MQFDKQTTSLTWCCVQFSITLAYDICGKAFVRNLMKEKPKMIQGENTVSTEDKDEQES